MKNNNKTPELATFTLLNPDFHVFEDQLQQEMNSEKGENINKTSENEE